MTEQLAQTGKKVLVLIVALAAALSMSVLGGSAHAATAADCGFRAFDVDTVHMDGGVVEFGDGPRTHEGFGDAVVCFASGRQQITVKGTVFWASTFSGCGYVGLGPTYYQATDPPVDGLFEVKVCSKGGIASAAVSHTFTTTNYQYGGLAIHLFRKNSDGTSTHLLGQVANYGD